MHTLNHGAKGHSAIEDSLTRQSTSRRLFQFFYWHLQHTVCHRVGPWLTSAGCLIINNNIVLITGRMPRSGKLPVLNLLTGQKSRFSPRMGDSLHRFTSNLAGPTGTWVHLPVQNFTSIATGGGNAAPKIFKNFHFFVKCRSAGATPLTDFNFFRDFYTPNYPTLVFRISCDSHPRLRSYCWETARR